MADGSRSTFYILEIQIVIQLMYKLQMDSSTWLTQMSAYNLFWTVKERVSSFHFPITEPLVEMQTLLCEYSAHAKWNEFI